MASMLYGLRVQQSSGEQFDSCHWIVRPLKDIAHAVQESYVDVDYFIILEQ